MIKVLFVCLGNICRSPMAEFLLKDMVKKKNRENEFIIESAGTSNEEEGNPVHFGTKRKLSEIGISTDGKYARQLTKNDYEKYDYILAMEERNVKNIIRIIGEDKDNKVHRLLDYSSNPRDIADPWYTGNFDETYDDIMEGLEEFLKYLKI
ncbi:MAG: low molecular weight protein-tyrosine-phosphatase [Clostridia bacterium]|nr:low molecular weight protein-tyrosine-phosphatase [Clostridia bacterium]